MCSLIRKSAVLLSILSLLPLASASAELKKVPLILMDTGTFSPDPDDPKNPDIAILNGDGDSTHLGRIVSTGVFEKKDRPSGGFKGKIEGEATATPIPSPSPISSASASASASASPSPSPTASPSPSPTPSAITYRLSAEFFPGAVPGVFYGVGTYRITGGTGDFEGARGFGEFIGLANFGTGTYNCFLRGVISY
jgi:hypothetical protein